jgi:L-iditol 2-dehydrogenase
MKVCSMRAAKLYAPGDMRLVEIDKPVPGPGEALIQIREVGICASDVHWYNDGRIGDAVLTDPLVLGHEFGGVIIEVGSGVSNVKPGDRVAVEPSIPCYKCDMCLQGRFNICRHVKFCGTAPTNGALCDYLAWPAQLAVPVPDSVSMGEAAMLEPLAIGLHAANLAGNMQGKTVGILGAGAVGLSILQAVKISGCEAVFSTDLIPMRIDLARKLGADRVFDARDSDVVQAVKDATGGRGLDIVFEATGMNDAVRQATEMVCPGGLAVIGGIPDDDIMSVSASVVRRKELTIQLLRRSNETLHRAIQLLGDGKLDAASLISHHFPLESVVEAFNLVRDHKDKALRVIVQVS